MTSLADYTLFRPLTLAKGLTLKNRIVYGPATRARADMKTHVPLERMAAYYEQRAGAGLLIAEACAISEQAFGWWGAPALYNEEQASGWKAVVDRVHNKGGKIFLQLWHLGRNTHPSFNAKGDVVSPSATLREHDRTRDANGEHVGYVRARALELNEIPEIVEDYRKCTELAKGVGFDGVEIHGANGCLVDQFLQSVTNKRTDKYGGSFENRYRFLHEIVEALKTVYPADRIAVRISPNGAACGMGSEDNYEMFNYTMERLSEHGLAYLSVLDGVFGADSDKSRRVTVFNAKAAFKGVVMANTSLTRDLAEGVLRSGAADLSGFVRLYMANPDLVERFRNDWPLNEDVPYEVYWDAHKGDEGYLTVASYDSKAEGKE